MGKGSTPSMVEDTWVKRVADTQRFYSIDDLSHERPPQWLVEDLFEANTLVMVAGPPGSYKSFLCRDWLLAMASGRKWLGKETAHTKVLYALGEGRASLLKRIETWAYYNQLTTEEHALLRENFRVTFEVPQMGSKSSVDNMLAELERVKYQPSVIAIDTFARSFVGRDENSQKDVGEWVEQADRLRSLGYTVIFLHHTAKNIEFGPKYRGSSAIMGAMDTAMTLVREGGKNQVVLHVTKQKDHEEGPPWRFMAMNCSPTGEADGGSVILAPVVNMDERFAEDATKLMKAIDDLIADVSFESDLARARELVRHFDISEDAARKRFTRRRRTPVPDEAEVVPEGIEVDPILGA